MIKAVLFDLDGTLLPMDQEKFTKGYFELLTESMSVYGYDAEQLVNAVCNGITAMVTNDGTKSNEKAFWQKFAEVYGEKALADQQLFHAFYEKEFQRAEDFCGCEPKAAETVKSIKNMGLRGVLATNPVFPRIAVESRIRWAGLEVSDFEYCVCYFRCRIGIKSSHQRKIRSLKS